jgi:hypothetical protein
MEATRAKDTNPTTAHSENVSELLALEPDEDVRTRRLDAQHADHLVASVGSTRPSATRRARYARCLADADFAVPDLGRPAGIDGDAHGSPRMLSRATRSITPYAIAATANRAASRSESPAGTPMRTGVQSPGSFSMNTPSRTTETRRLTHAPLALQVAPDWLMRSRSGTAPRRSTRRLILAGGKNRGILIYVTVTKTTHRRKDRHGST